MALAMWIIFSSLYFQKIPGIDKVFAELNSTIIDTNVLSGEAKTTVNDSLNAGVHEINYTQFEEQVRLSWSFKLRTNGPNNSYHCLLGQQCLELRPYWQWCANRCNNSQHCWDMRCVVGRIQPIRLWRPCVMRVPGPNNADKVWRAVQTDPTLLRYASVITEQEKCWEKLAQ